MSVARKPKAYLVFNKVVLVKEKGAMYDVEKTINTPQAACLAITKVTQVQDEAQEVLGILTLDTKNKLTSVYEISRGTLNASLVHPREVFKPAILHNAASIILFHNHPSGDPKPSDEDINVSKRIKNAGELLGIEVLDSVIIGDGRYVSAKEEGII